jgi:hypothetical protein
MAPQIAEVSLEAEHEEFENVDEFSESDENDDDENDEVDDPNEEVDDPNEEDADPNEDDDEPLAEELNDELGTLKALDVTLELLCTGKLLNVGNPELELY